MMPRARAMLAEANFARLEDPAEIALMRRIALYPRLVESAAGAHEPHRVAFYLYELASEFHALWTKGKDLRLIYASLSRMIQNLHGLVSRWCRAS